MANHVSGQAATATHPQTLSAHRRAIMDVLIDAQVITTAEYDTAMQRTLACQNLATLQRWYRNTVREIARREEAALPAPVQYATAAQKEEVIRLTNTVWISRAEKTKALLSLPRLDYAQANKLLAHLWAVVLHRQEQAAEGSERAHLSFSDAA